MASCTGSRRSSSTGTSSSRRTGARWNATRGFNGRGALQRWPETLGTWGHARRPSELAPIAGGCCLRDCHSHAAEPPHRAPPRPSIRRHQWRNTKRGSDPCTISIKSTSTQENGARCAAQRLGGRLVAWGLRETAERAPIASTCVACRSPIVWRLLALLVHDEPQILKLGLPQRVDHFA